MVPVPCKLRCCGVSLFLFLSARKLRAVGRFLSACANGLFLVSGRWELA